MSNPDSYTLEDLKAVYPQFEGDGVPDSVLELYLELAHKAIQKNRWRSYWKLAMGLFVAHFVTIWAMGTTDAAGSAAELASTGGNRGVMSSKSAGGVSITRDFSLTNQGLTDWAGWNQTQYGTQLATLAKLVGKGGIQIW